MTWHKREHIYAHLGERTDVVHDEVKANTKKLQNVPEQNCEFGHHRPGRPYFNTLEEAIFKPPIDLSGDLWVSSQTAPIIKRRIRHLRLVCDRWSAINHRGKTLNNVIARLRALEARR